MRFLQYAVVAAVPLLYISTENAVSAFQTLPRNRRHRHHWRRPQKSELSLSFPSIAVNNPKPRRDSDSANQDHSIGNVYRRTSTSSAISKNAQIKPRLSQTVPSGQKQLPLHVRIAKVRNMFSTIVCTFVSILFTTIICKILYSKHYLMCMHESMNQYSLIYFRACMRSLFRG